MAASLSSSIVRPRYRVGVTKPKKLSASLLRLNQLACTLKYQYGEESAILNACDLLLFQLQLLDPTRYGPG